MPWTDWKHYGKQSLRLMRLINSIKTAPKQFLVAATRIIFNAKRKKSKKSFKDSQKWNKTHFSVCDYGNKRLFLDLSAWKHCELFD
jgi:hypothetical protein